MPARIRTSPNLDAREEEDEGEDDEGEEDEGEGDEGEEYEEDEEEGETCLRRPCWRIMLMLSSLASPMKPQVLMTQMSPVQTSGS